MANTQQITAHDLWADIQAVRTANPLVHNITNLVVINLNANVLLAAGAAPVMAHAHEEVADMAGIAQSLVLNIGTLDAYWVQSMQLALAAANARGIPVVLDPVGAGATPYRNQAIAALLGAGTPAVIRGNGSEIISTAKALNLTQTSAQTRGVDSSASSGDAVAAARALAAYTRGTVCVSGETDHILHASGSHARLHNGHIWLTRITGVGCSLTALIGAVCAVQPNAWHATTAGMAWMGIAGEIAAAKAQQAGAGIGTMAVLLLDALQQITQEEFMQHLQLSLD